MSVGFLQPPITSSQDGTKLNEDDPRRISSAGIARAQRTKWSDGSDQTNEQSRFSTVTMPVLAYSAYPALLQPSMPQPPLWPHYWPAQVPLLHRHLIPLSRSIITPVRNATVTRSGPPMKPKRTAYTCWVGNLQTSISIEEVRDLFSAGAKDDIESVLLMQHNCAFVNYRTDSACKAAVTRCNGTRLGSNILLCRAKRPWSNEDRMFEQQAKQNSISNQSKPHPETDPVEDCNSDHPVLSSEGRLLSGIAETRYFILKALDAEDVRKSFQTGVWTTQLHVQQKLHDAFVSSKAVYLIFSVNKSGNYFGCALMLSSPVAAQPTGRCTFDGSLFTGVQIVHTPETHRAPAGKVTIDSARGVIFWEAVRAQAGIIDGVEALRPFMIQWITISPVPFRNVRHLRNPWNQNKEVQVTRDGTELESTVGERLLRMLYDAQVWKSTESRQGNSGGKGWN